MASFLFPEVNVKRQDAYDETWRLIKHGYHGSAISLIKKELATDDAFINEIAQWYIDRGQWYTLNGYEYLLHAYALEPLGLSRSIRERLLAAFVKWGFHRNAQRLAAGLGRLLTMDEVLSLVGYYTKGVVQSDATEKELRALAWEIGGEMLEDRVRRDIATMHECWKSEGFLR